MKENTILPIYVNQAIVNGKIEVWGDGKRKQNYIYVLDACEYIRRIIDKFDIVKGKVLLGVNKKEFSNLELAEIITEFTKAEILFKKDDKAISFQYNNDLTCQLLDFIPSSEFKVELQNYIIWKQKQY
jgi:dTDP-D-glucose 4,6-dehydratase